MTPSDDLSPPRRPIFFPVVIATVFLTIIGMTTGFVLGERRNGRTEPAADSKPEQSSSVPVEQASSAPSGEYCPEATRETAARLSLPNDLFQVMKISTENGTEVWICTDSIGRYYYQGKTGGPDEPVVEGTNALFLAGVKREGPAHFEVYDHRQTLFVITDEQLELRFADGKREKHDVATVE